MTRRKNSPTDKEMRALVRRFKPGYRLEPDRSSKYRVIGPDGEPVRQEDGRVLKLSGSPDARYTKDRDSITRRLAELGVIDE